MSLRAAYAHGPGKSIAAGTTAVATPPPPGRVPFAALVGETAFGGAVAALLTEALTPTRWEPGNAHNDHRAYPSPRAAYLVDAHLVTATGRLRVDPVRRALVGDVAPVLDRSVRLEFTGHPDRLPAGYGPLADALAHLETGHLGEAIAETAEHLGLGCAIDPAGVRLWATDAMSVHSPDRATRTSGFGPRGLSADPRALPQAAARSVIEAAHAAAVRRGSVVGVHVAVRNVTGLTDGWYATGPLRLLRACPAMDKVQAAFTYPRAQVDVAGMNLACVLTADLTAEVATTGYPAVLRAAGAVGQRAGTAAAAAGMFCRPVRSVHEAPLEAAIAAPPRHDVVYVLLAGGRRAVDLAYDLSPLGA